MTKLLSRTAIFLALTAAMGAIAAGPAAALVMPRQAVTASTRPVHYWFANPNYRVSENVGHYPILIKRSNAGQAGVICWGLTRASTQDGHTFIPVNHAHVQFAAGQRQKTVHFKVIDQGIHGPARLARAYMYRCGGNTAVDTGHVILKLLQNDRLQRRNPSNPLGYQTPTDGDPLQHVRWYVFGRHSGPGKAAARYKHSHPAWARKLRVLAYTPGSLSYRFWMWNRPTHGLAKTVEKYLADAEQRHPGTTVPLSTYSLVHGHCLNPKSIKHRYQRWIKQLARGIGNFRVVMYLEEDSLITTHCLTKSQIRVRMKDEVGYAVKALSKDPHVLIYLDAGAPDASIPPAKAARMLRMADVKQAAGFAVNTTHHMWTTTDIHYGQQISKRTGGAHFIVYTGSNGRGPLLNPHPSRGGVEILCNPPGRGLGPMTWKTGYRYVDALLWFNNPGNSAGDCGRGDPRTSIFFPSYAIGLVKRRVHRVTGPHFHLLRSNNDM